MKSLILTMRRIFMASIALVVVACSSVNNDTSMEEKYEIEDVVQTNAAVYSCDDKPLNIYFHGEQAELMWENKTHLLNHAVSALGSVYLGESLSFMIQDGKAKLSLQGLKEIQCRLVRVDS